MTRSIFFIILVLVLKSVNSYGLENPAILTFLKGEVQIFENPSEKAAKTGQQVLYEGKYYTAHKAKLGEKVFSGSVIHTGVEGKARIVYPNGDQINVAPASAIIVKRSGEGDVATGEIEMQYGKVRAFVAKRPSGKPQFHIKSPIAVAGVRGTDFTAGFNPNKNAADVSVIRGEVEVQDKDKKVKSQPIKAGDVVSMVQPKVEKGKPVVAPKVEVAKVTQEELQEIKSFSEGKLSDQEIKQLGEKNAKELKKLEDTVVTKKVEALKTEDPALYEKVKVAGLKDVNELDNAVIGKMMESAPKAEEVKKKAKEEVEKLKDDVYKKFGK